MLPQGEFRKFLSDDSNEKQKTLRKIFSTKVLDDFTEQLRVNVTSLKAIVQQHETRCDTYIESIQPIENDELSDILQSQHKDIPHLLQLINMQNEEQSLALANQHEKLQTLNEAKDILNIPQATDINTKFSLLQKSKDDLGVLLEKKNEFDTLAHSVTLLKQMKDIQAVEATINQLSSQKIATTSNIESYQKSYEDYHAKLMVAQEQLSVCKAEQAKLPTVISTIEGLKQKLAKLDKLNLLHQELSTLQTQSQKIDTHLKKLAKGQRYLTIAQEIDVTQQLLTSFSTLITEIYSCKGFTEQFLDATKNYQHKMNCFIDSQAFFLAGTLKEDAPCPVCGATNHPAPAKQTQHIVSQEELDNQKQQYDSSSRQLKEQQTICKQLLIGAAFDIKSHTKLTEFLPDIEDKMNQLQSSIKQLKFDLDSLEFPSGISITMEELTNKINAQTTAFAVCEQKTRLLQETISELQSENFSGLDTIQTIQEEIKQRTVFIDQTNNSFEESSQRKDALSSNVQKYAEAHNQQSLLFTGICNDIIKYQAEFETALSSKNIDVQEYHLQKHNISNSATYENELSNYLNQVTKCNAVIESLTLQLVGLTPLDLVQMQEEYDKLTLAITSISNNCQALSLVLNTNLEAQKKLNESYHQWENLSIQYNQYQRFYDIANGKFSDKINFERYVLASYFNDVIKNANIRLEQMTNSRYTLKRRTDKEKGNKSSGLALEVFDAYTGASRHVNTISGGESFKISLCLALGLADIISQNSGGIELNTIFIDEGFGSLDATSLDSAIECLTALKSSGRYIGIISHVSELKDKIPSKLFVIQEPQGSYIKLQE